MANGVVINNINLVGPDSHYTEKGCMVINIPQ